MQSIFSADNESMKKILVIFEFLFLVCTASFAQNKLLITPQDIRLEADGGGFATAKGYHLYVKKNPGVESVLLTETTRDPEGKSDNFAYRAKEWNSVNGDEIRYLDGKPLVSKYAQFSLVDSTSEFLEDFGECFHIYIPSEIVFGYPWERNGSVKIGRGTFINIRAFEKKYADYTGEYFDNPYMFDLGKVPEKIKEAESAAEPEIKEEIPALTDDYNPVAAAKFEEISETMIYSKGPETLIDDMMKQLEDIPDGKIVDVVFAIDATGSMKDDIEKLRKDLVPRLITELRRFGHTRLGLVLYRDYVDSWRYKNIPVKFFDFTEDLNQFLVNLKSFKVTGMEGGDIPEAVYEAMFASIDFYQWNPESVKKVILVGDAEPHPQPRGSGKYSKQLVEKLAKEKGISINAIILPDDKSRRGR